MARAFQIISAKPTFGSNAPIIYQSDYINTKKRKCNMNKVYDFSSYELKNAHLYYNNYLVNKSNLISGQYTKLNLNNICVNSNIFPYFKPVPCSTDYPCNPCQNNNPVIINPINATIPFYQTNINDPLGELFGKTQCGELNYTQYMEFYPPSKL
jgi:hypothetical protein